MGVTSKPCLGRLAQKIFNCRVLTRRRYWEEMRLMEIDQSSNQIVRIMRSMAKDRFKPLKETPSIASPAIGLSSSLEYVNIGDN